MNGIDVILQDLGLSCEEFIQVISTLKLTNRSNGMFNGEFNLTNIKYHLTCDSFFLESVAKLLFDGKYDKELLTCIPRYYLNKLNYIEIGPILIDLRRAVYKKAIYYTYNLTKEQMVESNIKQKLDALKDNHGIRYETGHCRMLTTDLNFAIPSLLDPWVVLMVSYEEINISSLKYKMEYLINAYRQLVESNIRFRENRVLINFVDGGGWLARKRDLERLVNQAIIF